MKAGFYSPLPPAPTGVADYSAALLDALRPLCDVAVNEPGTINLYHLGNNPLHAEIYCRALQQPGIAVLHDAVLHHFLLGALSRDAYIEEFVFDYGEWNRSLGVELWDERRHSAHDQRYFDYAMVRRVAERSRAVVVHNPGAARIVAAHARQARIVEIPHLFLTPPPIAEWEAIRWREQLGVAPGTFLFAVFGHLRETKRLHSVLGAFERVRRAGADAALLVAGDFVSSDLERAVSPLLTAPGIFRTGHLPERELWLAATASDACINLRWPAAGESSGIAIRLMGIGKPVLVSENEETSRLPETACVRVASGISEERLLVEHMMWFCQSPIAAREIGARGAAHIAEHHAPARVARKYWELLCEYSA